MSRYATVSNQWAIGFGLRRSTIYDTNRWMLWFNLGYLSVSWSWRKNPKAPRDHK